MSVLSSRQLPPPQYVFSFEAVNPPAAAICSPSHLQPVECAEGLIIGRYLVTNTVLGTGCSSEVRLAYCLQTFQAVAAKCISKQGLSPEAWVRIEREAATLRRLGKHPNVVQFYDVLHSPTHVFFFFEYVHGEDLLSLLDRFDTLCEEAVRKLFQQLLDAVRFCHEQNIAHLDIKLENVLVEFETGRIVLIDFGFAEVFHPTQPYIARKCGSPHYCAPEIVTRNCYDARKADVWSLGILLFILATGHFPFDDETSEPGQENMLVILSKIRAGQLSFPSTLSKPLQSVIQTLLTLDPDYRPDIHQTVAAWHYCFTATR